MADKTLPAEAKERFTTTLDGNLLQKIKILAIYEKCPANILLEEAITEAKAEKGDNRSIVKEIEKAKKRLAAKIKDRMRKNAGMQIDYYFFTDDNFSRNPNWRCGS